METPPTKLSTPSGLCECGCGKHTRIATKTNRACGHVKGRPVRFINGHNGRKANRYTEADSGYPTPCWLWRLRRNDAGYGIVRDGSKMMLAHRYYYERRYGPVPERFELDHLCRVRACVNPDHLEPVTHAVNCQRGSKPKLTKMDIIATGPLTSARKTLPAATGSAKGTCRA